MKNLFFTLFTLSMIFSLTNCKGGKHAPQTEASTQNGELNSSPQKPGNNNAGPTYVKDIKPLFEKNCLPCHDKGSALGNWLDYKTVSTKKALIKTRVFEKKDMPLGKTLPESQRALIAKWVDMGASEGSLETDSPEQQPPTEEPQLPPVVTNPEPPTSTEPAINPNPVGTPEPGTTPEPATDLDPEKITYVNDIKPFFEKYCSACHNENSGPMMPNWLQYDIAVLKKEALLDRVVVKKNMPLEGMPSPTLEERELLNLWIQKGMKYEIK